ncbi:MAG: FAD-dependent oxidoreductase, partial [Burkholderiaceae bacterium]|nr:FAD-dependent oxidoreductase [Burkholderiaceae bacterium]
MQRPSSSLLRLEHHGHQSYAPTGATEEALGIGLRETVRLGGFTNLLVDCGFINVDIQMRTNVPHIFAIGDIVGQPMLAHKAVHEAHVAAEVIAGELQ